MEDRGQHTQSAPPPPDLSFTDGGDNSLRHRMGTRGGVRRCWERGEYKSQRRQLQAKRMMERRGSRDTMRIIIGGGGGVGQEELPEEN